MEKTEKQTEYYLLSFMIYYTIKR